MRRTRLTLCALTAIAVPALAVTPTPASAAKKPIRLAGGPIASGPFCNLSVSFQKTPLQSRAQAVVRAAKTKRGRAARKGTKLVVEKCANGSWTAVSRATLGTRRTAKRLRLVTTREATGDYRVRIVTSKGRPKGGSAFFRVGVGELVDTPVAFPVKNQNRTALPCLNAPDGGTYLVRGSLVGPRAILAGTGSTGRGPDVALYAHGLGYGSFFWHFKDVPAYDYATTQSFGNHVSVVIDRLGYKSSRGPDDGNLICYSSQADMLDQIIRSLKAGQFSSTDGKSPKVGRVALIGHSAGSLVSIVTQGVFKSADAIGITGFNYMPSTLSLTQLGLASAGCFTDPAPGPSGARNYARFGTTDADFRAAHFFNVAPEVATAVLKQRSTDPCGDVTQAGVTFSSTPVFGRTLDVPTLITSGDRDALFPKEGTLMQNGPLFTADPKQTTVQIIGDAGHALTFSRTRDQFIQVVDTWLKANKF